MVVRVIERRRGGRVQRDVKMNPPFFRFAICDLRFAIFRNERVGQIAEEFQFAIRLPRDDLVEINVVGKFFQRGAGFVCGLGFQRGTQMDFADFDPGVLKCGNCVLGFFKFNGEMAAVVIHAEKFFEARVVFIFVAKLPEKINRLGGIFQQAERFGFEAEVQFAF